MITIWKNCNVEQINLPTLLTDNQILLIKQNKNILSGRVNIEMLFEKKFL